MKLLLIVLLAFVLLIPTTAFAQIGSDIDKKSIFNNKKFDITTKLTNHNDIPFYFEFDRSFTELKNNTYYELYKVIDSRNNQHVGDLRIYLGSSQWWDDNAFLQEKDSSGFSNVIKVKLFVLHMTEPNKIEDVSNSLSFALKVLVPEWPKEASSISTDVWFFDSINNAKRNDENKREDRIIMENKEITLFHDDVDFGSITIIVTENLDVTYSDYVSEDNELLEQIFDFDDSKKESNQQEEIICGEGTIMKNGQCVVDPKLTMDPEPTSSTGGGCLIATATFGSELAPQVQQLRELRDNQLLQTESGNSFMNGFNDVYYSFSSIIADYERENPVFREMVKIAITPMITSLSILNYVEMDSENSVLGYGISLIMLNIGMYFVAPVIVIMRFRKLNLETFVLFNLGSKNKQI